jgi:thiamine transport system substrate-binding protein
MPGGPADVRVVLGVSGGIAAYKVATLLRRFTEAGHEVTVVPTEAALRFVGEPTWAALSGRPVATGGSANPATGGSSGPTGPSATNSGSSGARAAYRCPTDKTEVLVAGHDSFALSPQLLAAFTAATGCTATILKSGDAGALTNKLVLTKASPIADAVFGIDNTFAGRAVSAGVLAPYAAPLPASATSHAAVGAGASVLTPIDYGDVCVNVDTAWFTDKKINPPVTLDDLLKPEYKDLFVTPGATTSSPGFAFLLATIGKYGKDGWADYWKKLKANDFTASGKGTRPIVLSYASSPPFTIPKGGTTPTTAALLDTCFRQTEYAAVLAGAKNPDGAKAFVDFMLSTQVQQAIPDSMYMFPADATVPLPKDWAAWAKVAPKPFDVPAADIEANRDGWLRQWTDVTSG